jgi:hypothetical protein
MFYIDKVENCLGGVCGLGLTSEIGKTVGSILLGLCQGLRRHDSPSKGSVPEPVRSDLVCEDIVLRKSDTTVCKHLIPLALVMMMALGEPLGSELVLFILLSCPNSVFNYDGEESHREARDFHFSYCL